VQLTLHTDYALRTLIYLALPHEAPVTVGEVAEYYDISKHHLVKVVQRLAAEGLVVTRRGRTGGLTLGKPADRIRIGDVVRRMEPTLDLLECFDPETDQCRISAACSLKGMLHRARRQFMAELDAHTVADVAQTLARPKNLVRLGLGPS
jgi:Rrf2 family nitric oxide-sensitive transcriptional repressor